MPRQSKDGPGRQIQKVFESEVGRIAAEQIRAAQRPPTAEEIRTMQILSTLDDLGGKKVGDDSIVFTGTQIVLPEDMQGKMDKVVDFLTEYEESMNTHFKISKTFNYRPYDVAAAFDRSMKRMFGNTGVGKAQMTMFGVVLPEYISVNSGPHGETLQVPWEKVQFSLLDADFYLSEASSAEYGMIGRITVEAPKRHRNQIEGFFKVVTQELRDNSIYRGHAITAHPEDPQFIALDDIDPAKVIYTEEVEKQLQVNLWTPLQYTKVLREQKIPLKRAVLLAGPNGTGKTMAGALAAMLAVRQGWTYILVRAEDDAMEALNTARMYSPAVVMIEDVDTLVSSGSTRDQVKLVLDRLDNVAAKGAEVMVVFTSNYPGELDKNTVRPGRIDAVIRVEALDAPGYERLVKAHIQPEFLDGDVDYTRVVEAMHYTDLEGQRRGFLPAFAVEAIQRSMRYTIARNQGEPGMISTSDLVEASLGMGEHIKLMDLASRADDKKPALDTVMAGLVSDALDKAVGTFAPIDENAGGIHSIFENVKVELDGK